MVKQQSDWLMLYNSHSASICHENKLLKSDCHNIVVLECIKQVEVKMFTKKTKAELGCFTSKPNNLSPLLQWHPPHWSYENRALKSMITNIFSVKDFQTDKSLLEPEASCNEKSNEMQNISSMAMLLFCYKTPLFLPYLIILFFPIER